MEPVFQHALAGREGDGNSSVAWIEEPPSEAVFGASKSCSARAAVHDSPISIAGP
jgi:hypothetical protein